MEMTVWRVSCRGLGQSASFRKPWSFLVATKSTSERDAVTLAKKQYEDGWWTENLLINVEEVGHLKAAEDLEIPQEEADF